MTQQRGSNASIAIGFESAYKTVATVGFVLPFNTCGVVGTKTRNSAATIRGNRSPVAPFSGNQDVGGPIVVPADSVAMAYWLHAMFGAPGTSGGGPYVHEFKIGASMPSFTLEKAFTDLASAVYERFLGCKIASCGITAGGDGELLVNMNILGASQSEQTSAFDAAPTAVSLARVENFDAAITEGGSSLTNATELTINIDFGLDPNQFVIGAGGARGDIPEGVCAITGTLRTLFESKALLDKALNDTESSLKLTITASSSSVLEFEIQELLYAVNGIPVDGPQGLLVNLDFSGYYDGGAEASALVARLTNGVASYSLLS